MFKSHDGGQVVSSVLGAGVGFLAHDLRDEVHELADAGARLGATEHPGPVNVLGGETGQGAAAAVGVG
ncbi:MULTISPECIES: hypothetical protein [unclassified Kitasatospora]|uniref:hypothetical protein n=1 Tax=unclassified Kitasatospora TaxID=2633591 RepID=UPI0037FDF5D2